MPRSSTTDDNILSISCLDEVVRRHLCAPEMVLSYVHGRHDIMQDHDRIREGESTTQPPPPSITFTVAAGTKALDWVDVGVGEY